MASKINTVPDGRKERAILKPEVCVYNNRLYLNTQQLVEHLVIHVTTERHGLPHDTWQPAM